MVKKFENLEKFKKFSKNPQKRPPPPKKNPKKYL